MGLADRVGEYFVALIVGVILLYVLAAVVSQLFEGSQLWGYAIAIVFAAAIALYIMAKRGID